MSRDRYKIYPGGHAYFLTCTTVGWLPVFTRPEAVKIIYDSWNYLQNNGRLTLFGYVILENHLHCIAAGPDLADAIGDFKSYTARCIIDYLEAKRAKTILEQLRWHKAKHKTDREYQVWQEGSHPEQIHDDDVMLQKLEYAHGNPVKRGYVDEPVHWRYSSARNYAGMPGLIEVTTKW